MIKESIRNFLNRRGYEIIKKSYLGDKYPSTREGDTLFFKTPIGNYYLPDDAIKDGIADTMARGRVFDTEIVDIAKRYIRSGSAVLDIGGNFGQMAILFSKLVGDNGKVYVFEAQDKVFNILNKNIQANVCKNIVSKAGAVYNTDGDTLIFPEPDVNTLNPYGSNSINPKLSKGREVKTFTIDSLNIQEPISFVKVDIQGSDLFALQGARNTILKYKMPIIFEFEQQFQEQFGTTFQDYVDFVDSINYKFVETSMNINYLILPK